MPKKFPKQFFITWEDDPNDDEAGGYWLIHETLDDAADSRPTGQNVSVAVYSKKEELVATKETKTRVRSAPRESKAEVTRS